jgi:magnesium-transporting ATPase (P-type)
LREDVARRAHAFADRGYRVLAIAEGSADEPPGETGDVAADLRFLGLLAIADAPKPAARSTIETCRSAGITPVLITGDHPATAGAVARAVGIVSEPDGEVVTGAQILEGRVPDLTAPRVFARTAPEQKLDIVQAWRDRGDVVAMTGDGVNDGPALQQADIGVAMGASGTDVAREAADLVLLDDHFATIVAAVELGRATFVNIRRFLTYHLTDNVAELVPFMAWAISGGQLPLALGVLQILALDIGTDLLPALALGAEPPSPRTMEGRMRIVKLIDRRLLGRVFGVLGPAEAAVEMAAFAVVLLASGWVWGAEPSAALLAAASGTAFTAVVLGQMATAFACRSQSRWVGRLNWRGNPLLAGAVAIEVIVLFIFIGVPPIATLLGGSFPPPIGWLVAATVIPAVFLADAAQKATRHHGTARPRDGRALRGTASRGQERTSQRRRTGCA